MMLSLCMVMAQANQVDPSSNNVVQRINYGVIFQEQSNMMLAQEYWLHTFHIPLSLDLRSIRFHFVHLVLLTVLLLVYYSTTWLTLSMVCMRKLFYNLMKLLNLFIT